MGAGGGGGGAGGGGGVGHANKRRVSRCHANINSPRRLPCMLTPPLAVAKVASCSFWLGAELPRVGGEVA